MSTGKSSSMWPSRNVSIDWAMNFCTLRTSGGELKCVASTSIDVALVVVTWFKMMAEQRRVRRSRSSSFYNGCEYNIRNSTHCRYG